MTINKTNFQINNQGKFISGDIYCPDKIENQFPLIIVSHGFKGFKDWGFFPYLSSQLAENNNIVVCFNFSLNGNPGNDLFFTNIVDFADNTITQEVYDLEFLISSLIHSTIKEFENVHHYWNGKIYLLGHSLGGTISLIIAQNNSLISKVALWASIAKFDRYTARQKKEWKEQGYLEFTNMRTNQLLRMNVSYLLDIEQNNDKYDLPNIISVLNKPVFLIHGQQDVTVPVKEALMLINADKNKIIIYKFIEKTGHTFGIEHPFSKTTAALEKAIKLTSDFFQL